MSAYNVSQYVRKCAKTEGPEYLVSQMLVVKLKHNDKNFLSFHIFLSAVVN